MFFIMFNIDMMISRYSASIGSKQRWHGFKRYIYMSFGSKKILNNIFQENY